MWNIGGDIKLCGNCIVWVFVCIEWNIEEKREREREREREKEKIEMKCIGCVWTCGVLVCHTVALSSGVPCLIGFGEAFTCVRYVGALFSGSQVSRPEEWRGTLISGRLYEKAEWHSLLLLNVPMSCHGTSGLWYGLLGFEGFLLWLFFVYFVVAWANFSYWILRSDPTELLIVIETEVNPNRN